MENPFSLSLMGKTMGQTPNNFTIIKLITIIFVYVSQLKKKKNLSYFSLLSHMQIICLQGNNPFFFFFFHYAAPTFFFSLCRTSFFFLFVFSLAHHTHATYILNSTASHS